MNVYYSIVVPVMAIMCIVFAWIIVGDIKAILRSMRSSDKHDTIRHKTGRNYGQTAVFIGTACLFVGTPQECEELADDMQHYAQQVRVDTLTGDETFNVI